MHVFNTLWLNYPSCGTTLYSINPNYVKDMGEDGLWATIYGNKTENGLSVK